MDADKHGAKDPNQVSVGPIIREQAKHFKEKLKSLIQRIQQESLSLRTEECGGTSTYLSLRQHILKSHKHTEGICMRKAI